MQITYTAPVDRQRLDNLLGAFALGLADNIHQVTKQASAYDGAGAAALTTLLFYPNGTAKTLGEVLELTQSGTARLLDRLEKDNLVVRGSGTDDRSLALRLTREGKSRAEQTLTQRQKVLAEVTADLTKPEMQILEKLVEKLLVRLTTDVHKADHLCRLCNTHVCPQDVCPVECQAREAKNK
jgi:MarR family transcriptional regulator, negative regulator of the multidrug operon emrRAB